MKKRKKLAIAAGGLLILGAALVVALPESAEACCVYRVYPEIDSLTLTPDQLWPPNHKMVEVTVEVVGTNIEYWEITGTEVLNVGPGEGDPNNDPDFEYDGQLLRLRAERSGKAGAREYMVTVTAWSGDQYGTNVSASASVIVPHDMGKN